MILGEIDIPRLQSRNEAGRPETANSMTVKAGKKNVES